MTISPYFARTKKLTICVNCLEVHSIDKKECTNCNFELILVSSEERSKVNQGVLFYAYQQRISLEQHLEEKNGRPYKAFSHIPYNELFDLIGSVATELTAAGVLYLLKRIKESINKKNIVLDDSRMIKSGLKPDTELLEKLISDNEELEKFIKYIEDYTSDLEGIHPHVLNETIFIKKKHNSIEQEKVNKLIATVQRELESKKFN